MHFIKRNTSRVKNVSCRNFYQNTSLTMKETYSEKFSEIHSWGSEFKLHSYTIFTRAATNI